MNANEKKANATYNTRFAALLHSRLREYHGFTEIEANNEVYYIMSFIGPDALLKGVGGKFENEAYVFPSYPRKGNVKRLNRRDKMNIALTINKCLDHAEFNVVEK